MDTVPVVGIAGLHQKGFEAEFDRDRQRMCGTRGGDLHATFRTVGKSHSIRHKSGNQRRIGDPGETARGIVERCGRKPDQPARSCDIAQMAQMGRTRFIGVGAGRPA